MISYSVWDIETQIPLLGETEYLPTFLYIKLKEFTSELILALFSLSWKLTFNVVIYVLLLLLFLHN